jgi:hypothetical protein
MSELENANTRQWCTMVKGANGRTWYRADSASTPDRSQIEDDVKLQNERYPELRFEVGDAEALWDIAPSKYRPWDIHGAANG